MIQSTTMETGEREPTPQEQRDRDSYLRWQEVAIEQLGIVINLFLTFAGAIVAFAAKTMMDSNEVLRMPARFLFHGGMPLLLLSITLGLAANCTRALDFRDTRRAARARMNNEANHDTFSRTADCYGKWTWNLFFSQTVTFLFGTLSLVIGIWCGFGHKI